MTDAISNESKQDFIYASFNKISANTLIVIKDQDDKIITAFKTERDIQNLLYSSSNLDYDSYKIYTGGTIEGEETNGLYTKINSYTNGEEITYNNVNNEMNFSNNNQSNIILEILIGEIVLLFIFTSIYIFKNKKEQQA